MYGFGHGAFAEFVAVPQGTLAPKPANLTFEQAAAVPLAAVTAVQCLRAGGIQQGQHVCIIGASGGVGTFAMQIARHLGARVTGVCSAQHVDLVRSLGAEQVIDYTTHDFTTGADRYDLALQLGGTYSPASISKVLNPRGTLIQSSGDGSRWLGPVANILIAAALNPLAGQTLKPFTAKVTASALTEISGLIESGHITPVIERTYPLAEAATAVGLVEEAAPRARSSSWCNQARRSCNSPFSLSIGHGDVLSDRWLLPPVAAGPFGDQLLHDGGSGRPAWQFDPGGQRDGRQPAGPAARSMVVVWVWPDWSCQLTLTWSPGW